MYNGQYVLGRAVESDPKLLAAESTCLCMAYISSETAFHELHACSLSIALPLSSSPLPHAVVDGHSNWSTSRQRETGRGSADEVRGGGWVGGGGSQGGGRLLFVEYPADDARSVAEPMSEWSSCSWYSFHLEAAAAV
jgi:hypothetical protein